MSTAQRSLQLALAALASLPLFHCGSCSAPASETAVAPSENVVARGEELFEQHCVACHGPNGDANGPAALQLFPPARDFTLGKFRLVSTDNGVPSQHDLTRMLARGMPGSSMPAWCWMQPVELDALAHYVRHLALEGLMLRLQREPGWTEPELRGAAHRRLTPGNDLPALGPLQSDAQTLARGRDIYDARCAACHGPDGAGSHRPHIDGNGALNWARDFGAGYFKGGASAQDIAHRIQAGMPGTAMAANRFDNADDLRALVAFVMNMIPPDAESRHVQTRARIAARRVQQAPSEPVDPIWNSVTETEVALAPTWWRTESIDALRISALHDGESVAIRVRWSDDSGVTPVFPDLVTSDGVALQFSTAASPPLFGMGSRDRPTNLWHRKALRFENGAGMLDHLELQPHARGKSFAGSAHLDAPIYHPQLSVPVTSNEAESMRAAGLGNRPVPLADDPVVHVSARWSADTWEIVFRRRLTGTGHGEIEFVPGTQMQLAFAIWNGSAGDRRGQKSISIWQVLALDP